MAFSVLTHTVKANDSGGSGTSTAIDTRTADLIVAVVANNNGFPATFADSQSNTWLDAVVKTSTVDLAIKYCVSPTTNISHTFSYNGTTSFASLAVAAFSGCKLTSPLDQSNSADTAGATTLATGSVTPSEDNELLIFGCVDSWTGTLTVSVGNPPLDQVAFNPGQSFGTSLAYQIQTAATARNPVFTPSGGSARMTAAIATFKAAASTSKAPFFFQQHVARAGQ